MKWNWFDRKFKRASSRSGHGWHLATFRGVDIRLNKFMRLPKLPAGGDGQVWHNHNFPWALSIGLWGSYTEYVVHDRLTVRNVRTALWYVFWRGKHFHRLQLTEEPCWTLFIHSNKWITKVNLSERRGLTDIDI